MRVRNSPKVSLCAALDQFFSTMPHQTCLRVRSGTPSLKPATNLTVLQGMSDKTRHLGRCVVSTAKVPQKWRMKTPLYIVGVATAFAVMCRTSIQAYGGDPDLPRPKYQFIFPYVPHQTGPISFDRPITCVFQTYSVAGYRKKEFLKPDSDILERADITPDESPNVWKITLHDKIANLIITGGGWEDIKNETWVVVLKTEKYLNCPM